MGKKRKRCAACWYYRKKCLPDCLLAPYFPSDKGKEDIQNVAKVFGASNFIKLMNSAHPHQRLAAETMIMEARARKSDPVHGLAGIAKALLEKLDNLTSELSSVNHQNQFHSQHSVVPQ
ncbi:hypothetical protein MKW98_019884 [Papaver atlanticum]|uniref:LOB domain-containing protein n=1 Tax=Papaver atlanticum TaxID=357466 RepID=A0AAD4S166_9MAGN|nr:hypothetical protein MKW98_019884 [Papaver atlanticum]